MVFDWLAREGWIVFNWWALATLAGVAVLPLLLRLLGGLPDRGYTLARPAGILLTGFTFWLLASLGFINNSTGSIILSWFIVLAVSGFVYFRVSSAFDFKAWWQENSTVVIVGEILFILLLVGWAIVKAHRNDIAATEKPMDLAFMSAIQRSETFPPNDPWLSDYTISYYYFGYLMASMFSIASGVWTTIGYNMHVAMLFALTGLGAFGVTYNLVRSRSFRIEAGVRTILEKGPTQVTASVVGVLAAVFVVLLGNFQVPFVELPYQTSSVDESYLQFWDLQDRLEPLRQVTVPVEDDDPNTPEFQEVDRSGAIDAWSGWWWFRSARAIRDHNLIQAENLENPEEFTDGNTHIEVIAEFPQFSFLLADSHPHMMALPYVLLAIGLALNVVLINQKPDLVRILLYGVCVGALVFLNTWDAPIYIMLIVGADALRRLRVNNGKLMIDDWLRLFGLGASLVAVMIIAYFPFLVGFRSQLGGILPNLVHPTQTQHLFLVLGPFFLLLPIFLITEIRRAGHDRRMNWRLAWQSAGVIFGILLIALIVFGGTAWLNPSIRYTVAGQIDASGGLSEILPEIIERRLTAILTPVILLAGIMVVIGVLFPKITPTIRGKRVDSTTLNLYPVATGFALLMIGAGLSLVLIPEFVYLRDNFGWRMNTIFKFYYQTWILLSVASAYGVYSVLSRITVEQASPVLRYAHAILLIITLFLGLMFPAFGIYTRMFAEGGTARTVDGGLTLDGLTTAVNVSQSDLEVLQCFQQLELTDDIVFVEAVGNSYDREGAGRTSAITGIPTVIGWRGHQSQWRGTSYGTLVASRPADIERLYTDLRFDVVEEFINRYEIDYIMYGSSERSKYGDIGEEKFLDNLIVVCESETSFSVSRIYSTQTVFTP